MQISIVIPVFNERESISALIDEIKSECPDKDQYEIVIVDDGSIDGTAEVLKGIPSLKVVSFRKNFGQTAAFDAGIKQASNDLIVTMDGDGQNDPKDIPALIKYLEENNLDVVSGWRKKRKDNILKRFISRSANMLRKILVNDRIHDSGCSLKVYRKRCFENTNLYGEMHRFIPALLKIKGYKIGEMEVNHRSRKAGKTKYTWSRTMKGFIDMLSVWFWNKYAVRPLHLLGGAGLIFIMLSFPAAAITAYDFLSGKGMSETAWPILTTFLFLGGLQLFISGLVADILIKSYYENTKDTAYSIKEIRES